MKQLENEQETIISEFGSKNKRLRISLSVFKGQPLLNIRYYYEDKNGEMQPTRKGLSVSRNRLSDIKGVLDRESDAILNFLETGKKEDLNELWEQKKKEFLNKASAVQTIKCGIQNMPGQSLYEVDYNGSEAQISLNGRNKFVQKFSSNDNYLEIFQKMAVAFDLSIRSVGQDESVEVQHALERMQSEYSRQLNNLVKG